MSTISILVPTCGRLTLKRALDSVLPQLEAGDEILVIGDGRQPAARRVIEQLSHPQIIYDEHGPTGFLGNAQRNHGATLATGDVLAFLDDDDLYEPQALSAIRRAAAEHPERPCMFRMRCLDPPYEKWLEPVFANENIGGGAFVLPNCPGKVPLWPEVTHPLSQWSDRVFIEATLALYPADALVWRPELIYHVPRASGNAP